LESTRPKPGNPAFASAEPSFHPKLLYLPNQQLLPGARPAQQMM
jgi:hypothetical protein